jgi:membrane peptidoglycan carboxypeptidase
LSTRPHFESGISPLTLFRDEPQTFQYGAKTYSPGNYGKAYSMHDVLLREGLVRSLNVVTVDLALRTGLSKSPALRPGSACRDRTRIRQWPWAPLR